MRTTKYAHSCLFLEHDDLSVIIDPGIYSESFKEQIISAHKTLDYILITHDHFDHMSVPLIKVLQEKFPDVTIIGSKKVVDKLQQEDIQAEENEVVNITITDAPHEKMFFKAPMTPNIAFTVFERLTHPGDSFHISKTAEILALPVVAPWGSTVEAYTLAVKLKPRVIIPIHDAMMTNEAIQNFLYPSLKKAFKDEGIEFIPTINGETFEV